MHNHSAHDHQTAAQGDLSSSRIAMAFILNVSFTIIEFIGGLLTNSTAIMADAVHDLGDSLSIGSAWVLQRIGQKDADGQFTYGYRRFSLFGALINSLVLIVGSIWVLNEAVPRLNNPVMPSADGMLLLAVLGVGVNGLAAYRLSHGKTFNERVLNWHLLEDVLGWVAVLIVSIVLQFADWPILDPLLSIGFTLFILFNVLKNLAATAKLFFQAVPDQSLYEQIHQSLLDIDGVLDVHHQHLWSLDGENHVLTAHIIVNNVDRHGDFDTQRYSSIKQCIAKQLSHYHLSHTTIEIELVQEACRDFGP